MSTLTRQAMLSTFHEACRPRERWMVGLEWEKEPVRPDGTRLPFDGQPGVEQIVSALSRFGWTLGSEGPRVIAGERDGATVTLEPGGQVELSTAPRVTIAELERDVRAHLRELQAVTDPEQVLWLSTGYSPMQPVEEIAFLPKQRYRIMREYLRSRGRLAHGMMKATTSVQIALDYSSEDDCGRKLAAALAVAPFVDALVTNSPLAEGRDTGWASHRMRCWLETDPQRTGLLDAVLSGGFRFEKYLDFVLAAPMMFGRDAQRQLIPMHGANFEDALRDGIGGRPLDLDDFRLQRSGVFPEVRLSPHLEIRGADNVPLPLIPALAALWKGLLYDADALVAIGDLAAGSQPERRADLHRLAAQRGLAGRWRGRRLRAWAGWLLEIAAKGLLRQAPDGPAEVAYLAPLLELAERGESPAVAVFRAWEGRGSDEEFLRAIAYPAVDSIPPIDPSAA
jgi:glutamate--cysteine ligase